MHRQESSKTHTHTKEPRVPCRTSKWREPKELRDQVLECDMSARTVTQRCTENQINRNMCEVSAARRATDMRNKQVLMVRHINVKPMKKPNLSNDVLKKKKNNSWSGNAEAHQKGKRQHLTHRTTMESQNRADGNFNWRSPGALTTARTCQALTESDSGHELPFQCRSKFIVPWTKFEENTSSTVTSNHGRNWATNRGRNNEKSATLNFDMCTQKIWNWDLCTKKI